jgi:branched-subunit amino acid ABC-type transport system permease component
MDLLPKLVGFGIVTGAMTAVPALGLTLMYGSSRFLNFAYGEWMTLAAFITLSLGGFIPLAAAIVVAVLLVSVYGVVANKVVFRPLANRHGLVLLVTSLGLSYVMQNGIRAIWGGSVRSLETPSALGHSSPVGPFVFTPLQLIILAVAVAAMAGMTYLLRRTDLGMKVRAAAESRDLARATGIEVERISAAAWAIASGLAGPRRHHGRLDRGLRLGFTLLLVVASSIILGGLGSAVGAVVGAFAIGIAMEVSTLWISPALKPAIAFAVLTLVLLIRPRGLFGGRSL